MIDKRQKNASNRATEIQKFSKKERKETIEPARSVCSRGVGLLDTRSSISRNKDERGRGSRWVEAPTSVQAGLDRPRALSLHAYYPNAST